MFERRQVGPFSDAREGVEHRGGCGVVLAHGRQPQNQLHRAQHSGSRVHRRIDVTPLGVRAGDEGDRAVGVDVVGAVLRVVFDDEDRRLFPVTLAVRDGFDKASYGQVVFGHVRAGRRRPGARALSVIPADTHDLKLWQLAVLLVLTELFEPGVNALVVGDVQIPRGKGRAEMAFERFFVSVVLALRRGARIGACLAAAAGFAFARRDELAVAAVSDSGARAVIPDVASRRPRDLLTAFVIVGASAIGVVRRPGLLGVIGGVGRHRPVVAVGRDLGVDVEVVEQYEFARQRVLIRRHVLAEEAEARIAVAFFHIAQHLVVGAVLFDHVDHMFDRRWGADAKRDRGLLFRRARGFQHLVGVRRIGVDAARELGEFRYGRQVDQRDRAFKHAADVLRRTPFIRVWALRIGRRSHAFAVGDEDSFAVPTHSHRGRIPAGRDEAFDFTGAAFGHVDYGDVVVVGVRYVERLFVGRERDGVGRAADGRLRMERGRDCFDLFHLLGRDYRDRVAVGVGDVKRLTVARQLEIVRMVADRNVVDYLIAGGVNHGDASAPPVTYINAFAVARGLAIVGVFADRDLSDHLPGRQVDDGDFVRQVFGHI